MAEMEVRRDEGGAVLLRLGEDVWEMSAGDARTLAGLLLDASRSERDTVRCEGPYCPNLIPAHTGAGRARRFCSDRCRQAAHRAAQGEPEDWAVRASRMVGGRVSPREMRMVHEADLDTAPETRRRVESGEITSVAGALAAARREREEASRQEAGRQ